jgi:hypothetical protein
MLHIQRLQAIQELNEQTPIKTVLPGEPGVDPLPEENTEP